MLHLRPLPPAPASICARRHPQPPASPLTCAHSHLHHRACPGPIRACSHPFHALTAVSHPRSQASPTDTLNRPHPRSLPSLIHACAGPISARSRHVPALATICNHLLPAHLDVPHPRLRPPIFALAAACPSSQPPSPYSRPPALTRAHRRPHSRPYHIDQHSQLRRIRAHSHRHPSSQPPSFITGPMHRQPPLQLARTCGCLRFWNHSRYRLPACMAALHYVSSALFPLQQRSQRPAQQRTPLSADAPPPARYAPAAIRFRTGINPRSLRHAPPPMPAPDWQPFFILAFLYLGMGGAG